MNIKNIKAYIKNKVNLPVLTTAAGMTTGAIMGGLHALKTSASNILTHLDIIAPSNMAGRAAGHGYMTLNDLQKTPVLLRSWFIDPATKAIGRSVRGGTLEYTSTVSGAKMVIKPFARVIEQTGTKAALTSVTLGSKILQGTGIGAVVGMFTGVASRLLWKKLKPTPAYTK